CQTQGRRGQNIVPCRSGWSERLRKTKVEDFDFARRRDLDIRRLEIAMNHALLVSELQRFRNLMGDLQSFLYRNGATLNPLSQRFTFDQLHDEEVSSLGFLESVERRDAPMIQRSQYLSLSLKTRDPFGIVCERFREHLHRHVTAQLRVTCAIDFSHSAGAQAR